MKIQTVCVLIGLYMLLSACGCRGNCNGRLTKIEPDDDPQNLTSPSYPSQYAGNLDCRWAIYEFNSDTEIKILDLDIENSQFCKNDNLTLYGYDKKRRFQVLSFCGTVVPSDTIYFGGAVVIEFITDDQNSGRGFSLQYHKIHREDEEDNGGYIHGWGVVLVVVILLVSFALIVTLVLVVYCRRRKRTTRKRSLEQPVHKTRVAFESYGETGSYRETSNARNIGDTIIDEKDSSLEHANAQYTMKIRGENDSSWESANAQFVEKTRDENDSSWEPANAQFVGNTCDGDDSSFEPVNTQFIMKTRNENDSSLERENAQFTDTIYGEKNSSWEPTNTQFIDQTRDGNENPREHDNA